MMRIKAVCMGIALFFALGGIPWAADLPDAKSAPMRMDAKEFRTWAERHRNMPRAKSDPAIAAQLSGKQASGEPTSMDLLSHLSYVAADRVQGKCGSCWVWSSTALYEIMLSVNKGIKDRLSIQYTTSCKTYSSGERCACCGGDLGTFTAWYNSQGAVIPWSNTNASYADGARTCSGANVCSASPVSCDSIAKDTSYGVDKFQAEAIETHGITQKQAIENIKNVLNQKRAVEYSFALANSQDWDAFDEFWTGSDETVLWRPDKYCGKQYDPSTGIAHATALVGYNDDATDPAKHYWIVLESNGTAGGKRPNGLFRIPMYMNYDCKLKQEGVLNYVTHFEALGVKAGKSLSLNLKGTGEGRIVSDPPGIDCSTSNRTCTANFDDGETVVLTATANPNSTFKGWTGTDCSGTEATCTLVLDEDVDLEDEFDSNCTYEISPTKTKKVGVNGGTFTISVKGEDGEDCPSPQVASDAPWIGTKASVFKGNRGTVKVTVARKPTPGGRQASIAVADQSLIVDQAGVVCKLSSLAPGSATLPSAGEQDTFTVRTQEGCEWQASTTEAWIVIHSGTPGTGPGEVSYSVIPKAPGARRTGKINITLTGDPKQKKVFTVTQSKQ